VVGDADAICRLIGAGQRDFNGRAETVVDGVQATLERPGLDAEQDTLVVYDAAGELAAWAWVHGGRRSQIDVDPGHRGLGLGSALLDWVEARAAESGSHQVSQTVEDSDLRGCELLRARGYEVLATNWRFELPVAQEPVVPELPAGITLRPFRDGDGPAAHVLIEDAFDEWQPRRKEYEEWARLCVDRSSFAPALSPLAFTGDELIGAALCLDLPGSAEGYVEQLAVRRDHRGRGLAKALLLSASRGFYREGRPSLTLWTHSGTGARAMYERIGMTVTRSTTVFARKL
jgi:ribosomal protein S18 acetylase RimI-like enzyme